MQSRKEKEGYWLILEKGEEIKETISRFASENGISGAQIWGIGAAEAILLGYFDVKSKKYVEREFSGSHELISFSGNINEDGLHAHMVISGSDFIARGGHLVSAKVSVVGEFFILPTDALCKVPMPQFGLKAIKLKKD